MSVAVFPLGPLETNCYIVSNEGQAVAIDVGGDPAPVSKYLKEHGLELKAICITHMHFDHLYGVAALAAETHATVYTPEKIKSSLPQFLGRADLPVFLLSLNLNPSALSREIRQSLPDSNAKF